MLSEASYFSTPRLVTRHPVFPKKIVKTKRSVSQTSLPSIRFGVASLDPNKP